MYAEVVVVEIGVPLLLHNSLIITYYKVVNYHPGYAYMGIIGKGIYIRECWRCFVLGPSSIYGSAFPRCPLRPFIAGCCSAGRSVGSRRETCTA